MTLPHVFGIGHSLSEEEAERLLVPEAARFIGALGRKVVGVDTGHLYELFVLYDGAPIPQLVEEILTWILDPGADAPEIEWHDAEASIQASIPVEDMVLHLALQRAHPHQIDWWVTTKS